MLTQPLLRPLPDGTEGLADLVLDLRWTWSHALDRLWEMLDRDIWERTGNPWLILQVVSQRRLEQLAGDPDFRGELERALADRESYHASRTWFGEAQPEARGAVVAYFSMEYGLTEALPLYSGGLGVLAGDHLKTASDLGVPIVAVGLLYQEGFFRQIVDANGVQREVYPQNPPSSLPITAMRDAEGAWLSVPIPLPGRQVVLRVWRARVGRVDLYLLDSNDPMNSAVDRGITSKLYGGSSEVRLLQEIALGVGGWRALEALGIEVDVCHLNEGHAAAAVIERAHGYMRRHGVGFREALWATRAGNVFTTHTAVPAAFDTYSLDLLGRYGRAYGEEIGVEPREILALGQDDGDHDGAFGMAFLAMRTCATVNGVSRLHGEVSRRLFRRLFPRWPEREVPVTHVTNGVHTPTWDSPWADAIWTEACGKARWYGALERMEDPILALDDETLWTLAGRERHDLVRNARVRLARQLGRRGEDAATVAEASAVLDPNALTLGFARRFTGYKRPNLLLEDPDRLARLLSDRSRPVQLIVAGKAHPDDAEGKALLRAWADFVRRPDVRLHAVFLEDYDIGLAQELVQGVDVWINTPRRPWEACGTSGMKVLVNGGLNVSELDGWWAEAWSPEVGWAIGDGREQAGPDWDRAEAGQLFRVLEEEIVPAFYDRDAGGIPRGWIARVRAGMSRLAPLFSSNRMLREYVERIYLPAIAAYRARAGRQGLPGALLDWERRLRRHWPQIHFAGVDVARAEEAWSFAVSVHLGDVDPDDVEVQLYAEPVGDAPALARSMERAESIPGVVNGYVYRAGVPGDRSPDEVTPRVVPRHPEARVPIELPLIAWQR